MPAADDDDVAKVEGEVEEETLPAQPEEPRNVLNYHRHTASKSEVPEADEFGLPVRTVRRRNFSLDELESPEEVRHNVLEEALSKLQEESQPEEIAVNGHETDDRNGEEHEQPQQHTPKTQTADEKVEENGEPESKTVQLPPLNPTAPTSPNISEAPQSPTRETKETPSIPAVSEWSHQHTAMPEELKANDDDDVGEWQDMPALATHRVYDDWGKVLAKSYDEVDDDRVAYGNLGGAGRGYTRVQVDDDAQSATSLDENTAYLFKGQHNRNALDNEDEEGRDILSQMQTTKQLLTESQRIAYVGIVRLSLMKMTEDMVKLPAHKSSKRQVDFATEALRMWGQRMMFRLYSHMEVNPAEQLMVEQLTAHGVIPTDLTPALMQNARIKSSESKDDTTVTTTSGPASTSKPPTTPPRSSNSLDKSSSYALSDLGSPSHETDAPPAYEDHKADTLAYQNPETIAGAKSLDLDIRWTILCDLLLLMLSNSAYDSRARTLLELVGSALSVPWQEICRFEKRVTDALEMQEQADKENWNEDDHLKAREQAARKKRLMVMGICTVGGGLVIGLSAGLLAPVIGAGLAAGFTGLGVAGTSSFLTGTGAAALIGTTGTLIGGKIGIQTSGRRTGAVKTFEYKPLFNNKRTNLIVTVAGWMTGKVDDVRLPFSTINPIMGDIYSVNWEPEMLQSTGATIQILATEALTQTVQQILGATILSTLMAGLMLPMALSKISYLIDNPWTISLARADSTGLILADSLIDRNLGVRPITLVGFSLGSRVIFSCLKELSRRGAVGLVQNVYMFGSPIVVKKDDYTRARSIVSGRFVNAYATHDWILGYLFRATSGGISRVAGLATVEVPGIENIDVTESVPGHMAYRGMMPILLDQVGWEVESFEFSEIDDPDPDNHEQRQRELINEIEEARRQMDQQPEKKGFKAFFSRKKAPNKKVWETYDERSTRVLHGDENESERVALENQNVLFDVDAIRKEALALALQNPDDLEGIKAHLSVREIPTTLPALKLSSTTPARSASGPVYPSSTPSADPSSSRPSLRQSQSHHHSTSINPTSRVSPEGEITLSFDASPERPFSSPSAHPSVTVNGSSGVAGVLHHPKPHNPTSLPVSSSSSSCPAAAARSTPSPLPPDKPTSTWSLRGARSGVSGRPNMHRKNSSSPAADQKKQKPPSPKPVVSPDRDRSPVFGESANGKKGYGDYGNGNGNRKGDGYGNGYGNEYGDDEGDGDLGGMFGREREVEMTFE